MKDNSDIPLPSDQLKSKVLVFAIIDEAAHEYEEITKGYVQLSTDQDEKNNTFHYLEVKDEETNQVLMRSNLKFQNNFGKQKGSIISWTDEQQPQYQEIALSFQKQKECEMFWRVICQKIGKNHLEIKGAQKIQLPNQNNLAHILQETKNNVQLFDYNVAHEGSLILGLNKVYQQMKENSDEMGMGIVARIINNIMSPNYSSGAIQALLEKDNFKFLLEVQQFKKGIRFCQAYEISIENHLSNHFKLPQQIFDKIVLNHRAIFYRENVLNLIQDSLLENMLLMISREAQVEIMSFLNRSKFLQYLVSSPQGNLNANLIDLQQSKKNFKRQSFDKCEIEQNKLNDRQKISVQQSKCSLSNIKLETLYSQEAQKKLNFIFQALIMYQQISSQQIKATFKQNIFSDKVFSFLQVCIQNNCPKALQLLYSILQMDKFKFFNYLVEEFKADSSNNLLKILIKKYLKQKSFQKSILCIIESLVPLLNQQKDLFDFFTGTFVFSVMSLTKQTHQALVLINTLLWNSVNTSPIFSQIKKLKTLNKIVEEYRNGTGLKFKAQELQMVKMLKYILIELAQKGQKKDKQMEDNLIESGFLQCCIMIYLKYSMRYNLISSSMLENFKIIQKISYSKIHKYILQEYSTNQSLIKILEPIRKNRILFQNKSLKTEVQVTDSHQIIHKSILQSQHLDNYLMNDDNQSVQSQINSTSKKAGKPQQTPLKNNNQVSNQSRKDQDLLIFKRIMSQISQFQGQLVQNENGKRKLVKKQQNNNAIPIEICLELPSIDQLQDHST